jgi:signal transduction histidine kinase
VRPTLFTLILLVAVPMAAAGEEAPIVPPVTQPATERQATKLYEQGLDMWESGHFGAWLVLRVIRRDTDAGRQAEERLNQADVHYRKGLDLLERGDFVSAGQALRKGQEIGPIDPHHYLRLGNLYRELEVRDRAVNYYGRYMAFLIMAGESPPLGTLDTIVDYLGSGEATSGGDAGPAAPDGGARPTKAPVELPDGGALTAVDAAGAETVDPARAGGGEVDGPRWSRTTSAALAAGVMLSGLALVFALVWMRRGLTLRELIDQRPEVHPNISYAIGCMRHELLKHRLGALGDAIGALRAGTLSPEQLGFLQERLYGGESLSRLWRIYLGTFVRLSQGQLNLTVRDADFRRAARAVRALERLRRRFAAPTPELGERLEALRHEITRFDGHLRAMANGLCRARVDGHVLREVVLTVKRESRIAPIRLDEIRIAEHADVVFVEVFRGDLVIILQNLVRNAILAIGSQPEGARRVLGLEVALRTEPTGDESVLIKILDTSPEQLTTEDIYSRRVEHGLGLVAAAVTRYDGSLFVEPARGDWTKAVVVRFFRALVDDDSTAKLALERRGQNSRRSPA